MLEELKDMCEAQYMHSIRQGFWDIMCDDYSDGMAQNDILIAAKLGLVHSEVSEALEEYRINGATEAFAEELADVVIRIMDIAGSFGFDLGAQIEAKMKTNQDRPYRHGKKF